MNAYRSWAKAESEVPRHEYMKGYRYRTRKATLLYIQFSDLCGREGLDAVDVAMSLVNKTITIK